MRVLISMVPLRFFLVTVEVIVCSFVFVLGKLMILSQNVSELFCVMLVVILLLTGGPLDARVNGRILLMVVLINTFVFIVVFVVVLIKPRVRAKG